MSWELWGSKLTQSFFRVNLRHSQDAGSVVNGLSVACVSWFVMTAASCVTPKALVNLAQVVMQHFRNRTPFIPPLSF